MPTIIELGQKVKAKYPDYADMSDEEVGRKVKAKFPNDYADFEDVASGKQLPWYARASQGALESLKNVVAGNKGPGGMPLPTNPMIPGVQQLQGDQVVDPWHPSNPANKIAPKDPMSDLQGMIDLWKSDPARAAGQMIPFMAAGGASNGAADAAEATARGAQGAANAVTSAPKAGMVSLASLPIIGQLFHHPEAGAALATVLGLPRAIRGAAEGVGRPAAEDAAQMASGDTALQKWVKESQPQSEVDRMTDLFGNGFERNADVQRQLNRRASGDQNPFKSSPQPTRTPAMADAQSLTPEGQAALQSEEITPYPPGKGTAPPVKSSGGTYGDLYSGQTRTIRKALNLSAPGEVKPGETPNEVVPPIQTPDNPYKKLAADLPEQLQNAAIAKDQNIGRYLKANGATKADFDKMTLVDKQQLVKAVNSKYGTTYRWSPDTEARASKIRSLLKD